MMLTAAYRVSTICILQTKKQEGGEAEHFVEFHTAFKV